VVPRTATTTARWGRSEVPDATGVHAATPMVITPRPMDTTGSPPDAGVAPVPRAGDAEARPNASAGVCAGGGKSPVTASITTPAGPARATAAVEASDGGRSPSDDSVAPVGPPVQLLSGLDKGGRTCTVKVYLGIANQRRPASVGNSVVSGVFPCRTDNYAALRRICALWLADIDDLRSRGLLVGGVLRSVLLILKGDYAWMKAFCGHSGASSRHPCLLCPAVGPRWEGEEQLVALYGCLQHSSQCRGEPRTVEQAAEVCRALGSSSENTSLARPMTHDQHRSIQRQPLMLVPHPISLPCLCTRPWASQMTCCSWLPRLSRPHAGLCGRPSSVRSFAVSYLSVLGSRLLPILGASLKGPSAIGLVGS